MKESTLLRDLVEYYEVVDYYNALALSCLVVLYWPEVSTRNPV